MSTAATAAASGKTRPASKAANPPRMCVVDMAPGISYAMTLTDGLALMRLMSSAVEAERDWTDHHRETYHVRGPAHAELRMIRADQLIQPIPPKPAPVGSTQTKGATP